MRAICHGENVDFPNQLQTLEIAGNSEEERLATGSPQPLAVCQLDLLGHSEIG